MCMALPVFLVKESCVLNVAFWYLTQPLDLFFLLLVGDFCGNRYQICVLLFR
jgi:hypothetical protein